MAGFAFVVLLLMAVPATSIGDETASLTASVARISSDAWIATGFDSVLEITDAGLRGEIRIDRLALPGSGQVFDDVRIVCASIVLLTGSTRCPDAVFTLHLPGIGRQSMPGSFRYDHSTGAAEVDLSRIAIADGQVRARITSSDAGIDVTYTGTGLQLTGLHETAAHFSDAFAGYSVDGLADITGTFSAPAEMPVRFAFDANVSRVSLTNDAGTIAADGVAGRAVVDVTLLPDSTRMTVAFDSGHGEAYLEPVYANFSESPLRLRAQDVATPDFSMFDIPRFRVRQEALLDMSGSARIRLPTDESPTTGMTADVKLRDTSVDSLYTNLVKIAAAGTVLGDLETAGTVSGTVSIEDSELRSATVTLKDVILDDRGGRFAIYALDGAVDWDADGSRVPGTSRLNWESGSVYSISVGGGTVDLQLGDNDVELLAPLRLPVLGGALLVNRLVLNDFGSEDATGILDAELEPVQLGQLTGAFGWPAFSGSLSGRLPLLNLAENTITVGGTLTARAFDGTMEVSDLRIEQPFGLVPRLQADLGFRDLDLQRVTEAFSFGLIQGRLSGDVRGLTMQSWRPVAMDMHFYTPANDRSQHRISQRAVENLASVGGGGAAAVLSTGFLKFFDVFAYDRIGLRCMLNDGVCRMSGVGPAQAGGYYIVKGSGIPRIDVVGFRDTVSWPRLVQQLAAITRAGSPTVN